MRELGTVLTDGLNVHDGVDGNVIHSLKKGDIVNILPGPYRGKIGDWRKIEYAHAPKGNLWVMTFDRHAQKRFVDILEITDYAPPKKPAPLPPFQTQDSRGLTPRQMKMLVLAIFLTLALATLAMCAVYA